MKLKQEDQNLRINELSKIRLLKHANNLNNMKLTNINQITKNHHETKLLTFKKNYLIEIYHE